MPYLEVRLGPDNLLLRFVGRIDYVFGRLPKADIQLRDMSVSRLHSQIFMDSKGNAFVRDLGSSGGTFLNDAPAKGIRRLKDGARVRIGQARVNYYDADPPVNAKDPPAKSDPKGLIRCNARHRYIGGNETVLAAERVITTIAMNDENEPAEPPPVVNFALFSDEKESPRSAQQPAAPKPEPKPSGKSTTLQGPAPKLPKKRTGIVQAPWDESWPPTSGEKRKPPTSIKLPDAAQDAAPPQPKPASPPMPPLPAGAPTEAPPRFSPRPVPRGAQPRQGGPGTTVPPAPQMPTAPLGPPPSKEEKKPHTKRTLAEEMMEEYSGGPVMPTVKLGDVPRRTTSREVAALPRKPASTPHTPAKPPSAPVAPARASTPAAPAKPPSAPAAPPPVPAQEAPADGAAEPELTTDEIAEYFGGQRKSGKLEEVNFGGGTPAPEEGEAVNFGPGAKLGADNEDELDESELDLNTEAAKPSADVLTPPPPAPAPLKPPTRKLMLKRSIAGSEDPTVVAPPSEHDAKTVYIPKPEGFGADALKPKVRAQGPGGDTFHVPKDMAAELAREEERLRKKAVQGRSDIYDAAESLPEDKKAKPPDSQVPGDTMTD